MGSDMTVVMRDLYSTNRRPGRICEISGYRGGHIDDPGQWDDMHIRWLIMEVLPSGKY